MSTVDPNRCNGAAFDKPHRMTTNDRIVTTELRKPNPIRSVRTTNS